MQKYLLFVLLIATLISLVVYPEITPILGIITLLLSLAFSTYAIYTKHKGTENASPKILKEVSMMVLTLIVILFLGGIVAMLENYQVGMRWGEVAGVISAIAASFGLELTDWKGPIKDKVNNSWDANVEPIIKYAFNQPPPIPTQPPMSIPTPSTETPISTPSPEQSSPREVSDTGDE